jgi:signal peptidase I
MTRGGRRISLVYGVLAIMVLSAVAAVYFLGLGFYIITGGSMEGLVHKGSLAIDRRVPTDTLLVGDVITYQPPHTTGNITHRIIAITTDDQGGRVFQTKGDANEAVDPWTFTLDNPEQAKYVASIPWLGYFLAFFSLRLVKAAVLGSVGVGVLIVLIVGLRETYKHTDEDMLDDGWRGDERWSRG